MYNLANVNKLRFLHFCLKNVIIFKINNLISFLIIILFFLIKNICEKMSTFF